MRHVRSTPAFALSLALALAGCPSEKPKTGPNPFESPRIEAASGNTGVTAAPPVEVQKPKEEAPKGEHLSKADVIEAYRANTLNAKSGLSGCGYVAFQNAPMYLDKDGKTSLGTVDASVFPILGVEGKKVKTVELNVACGGDRECAPAEEYTVVYLDTALVSTDLRDATEVKKGECYLIGEQGPVFPELCALPGWANCDENGKLVGPIPVDAPVKPEKKGGKKK